MIQLKKQFNKWDGSNAVKTHFAAKAKGFNIKLEYISKHWILTITFSIIFTIRIDITDFVQSIRK